MNRITQEPKSMYLAVELEYRREYEATHELRTLQARIADLEAQLYAIGASGAGWTMPEPQQDDAPLRCDVCGVECANPWHFSTETKRHKHACDACWDRMKIPGQVVELGHTPAPQQEPVAWRLHPFDYGVGSKGVYVLTMRPEQVEMWNRKGWRVEPLYTAPQQPAQQEPVAWASAIMEQAQVFASAWSLVGGRFDDGNALECADRAKEELRSILNHPQPAHQPLTDGQIIEIANKTQTAEPGTNGYILPISFARAIEQAHGITGDQ